MTETATVFIQSSEHDTFVGSTGSLVPGAKARIVDVDGNEITDYETPGELLIQSHSVSLGYFNNPKATSETFFTDKDGRWIRTGDEVLVRKAPSGNEHFVVVDRVKELIKVKVRKSQLKIFAASNSMTGSSSCTCRTRSTPPHPPSRRRLCSHSSPRSTSWRGPQGLRCQIIWCKAEARR